MVVDIPFCIQIPVTCSHIWNSDPRIAIEVSVGKPSAKTIAFPYNVVSGRQPKYLAACVCGIACEAIQQHTSSRMQGHLINSWEVTYTNRNVFCAHDTANGIYGGVKTIIFWRRHYAVTLTVFQCIFIAGVNIISTCRINVIDGQYMLLRLKISTYRYILGGHHKATVYNLNGDTRCGIHYIVA